MFTETNQKECLYNALTDPVSSLNYNQFTVSAIGIAADQYQ